MGRTILVGDVHGCPDELGDLLDRVRYAQGVDALLLVGDLVARGPDSGRAVRRAQDAGARAVRGNHDERVLRFWRVAREHGRKRALEQVKLGWHHKQAVEQLGDEEFAWLEALPCYLLLPLHNAVVVHAGLDPTLPVEHQEEEVLYTVRSIDAHGIPTRGLEGEPWARVWKGPAQVVFGHDARRGLQLEGHATGLDTGCCYGRALTALVLEEGEPIPADTRARRRLLHSVPARKTWCPMGDGTGPE